MPNRIFLLSPANCSGRRAEILLREQADFDLARRLRSESGAPLGETFAFLSGLYFRGKLAYASRFGQAPPGLSKALVITAGRGLVPPETIVTLADLRAFASVPIDHHEAQYREPLVRDARELARRADGNCQFVLLGSVALPKYREILSEPFGERLHFPIDFVGRGDMSRGGLMLRCVQSGQELQYNPLIGATLRGTRPAKLVPQNKPAKG